MRSRALRTCVESSPWEQVRLCPSTTGIVYAPLHKHAPQEWCHDDTVYCCLYAYQHTDLQCCRLPTTRCGLLGPVCPTDRRAVGTHSLNEHSSRSHMVIRLHVDGTVDHGVGKARLTASGSGAAAVMKVQSVLNLVDLAVRQREKRGSSWRAAVLCQYACVYVLRRHSCRGCCIRHPCSKE